MRGKLNFNLTGTLQSNSKPVSVTIHELGFVAKSVVKNIHMQNVTKEYIKECTGTSHLQKIYLQTTKTTNVWYSRTGVSKLFCQRAAKVTTEQNEGWTPFMWFFRKMLHCTNQQIFRKYLSIHYWQNIFVGWILPAGCSLESPALES